MASLLSLLFTSHHYRCRLPDLVTDGASTLISHVLLSDKHLIRASSLRTPSLFYEWSLSSVLTAFLLYFKEPFAAIIFDSWFPSLIVNTRTSAFLGPARCPPGLHSSSCLLGAGWSTVGWFLFKYVFTSLRQTLPRKPTKRPHIRKNICVSVSPHPHAQVTHMCPPPPHTYACTQAMW